MFLKIFIERERVYFSRNICRVVFFVCVYAMRSSAKTETVPFANVVFVAFDRFEPFFAAIVDLWQTATIVGWQKGRL